MRFPHTTQKSYTECTNFVFLSKFLLYLLCVWGGWGSSREPQSMCGGQRATCSPQFSPSIVDGIELRPSVLVAGILPSESPFLPFLLFRFFFIY